MRFLIIDDSKTMRNMVIRTLKSAGYDGHEFLEAETGKQGLEVIYSQHPDITLTDWHMPEMSGLELIETLKSENISIKIGLVTTERHEDNLKRAREAGALFIVNKPFTVEDLQDALIPVVAGVSTDGAEKIVENSISLPSSEAVLAPINAMIESEASLFDLSKSSISERPYIVALYADKQNVTKAIWIFDFHCVSFLGAAYAGWSPKKAYMTIASGKIPNEIFDNVKAVSKALSTVFHDASIGMRATYVITQKNEKLDSVIESEVENKKCYRLEISQYGTGEMLVALV